MNFKDLQWFIPSIHGIYDIKIQDLDKGYRISKGYWNGIEFILNNDTLNATEFINHFHFAGFMKN